MKRKKEFCFGCKNLFSENSEFPQLKKYKCKFYPYLNLGTNIESDEPLRCKKYEAKNAKEK